METLTWIAFGAALGLTVVVAIIGAMKIHENANRKSIDDYMARRDDWGGL